MKKFLALYIGSATAAAKAAATVDEDMRSKGVAAWRAWMRRHGADILDPGTPLGPTKRASAEGVADSRNNITAYVIVQAETHDAAARLFEDHPHFTIFPGDSVEIVECLAMPGS
jgi:hypothetical protein